MRLTKLILEDIGIYRGHNEFEFPTKPDRPIVLYGGINGAGKSTMFESIPLCLYGQNGLDIKMTKKKYHQKIQRLFHRYKDKNVRSQDASISLEFEYARNGDIFHYKITRNWQNNEGKVDEFLTLYKKSGSKYTKVNMVNDSQVQLMINQMIPRAIAGLFFFDGEKIKDIAQNGDEHLYIKSSFDSLLGLNIADQLRKDIGLHILRSSGDEDKAILAELEQLNKEKKTMETKLIGMNQKRIFLNGDISLKNRDLEEMERQFFEIGGAHAEDRERLMRKKEELSKHMTNLESRTRQALEGDLPLATIPEQLEQVRNMLLEDGERIKISFTIEATQSAYEHLMEKFGPSIHSQKPAVREFLMEKLQEIINAKMASISNKKKPDFDFSLSDMTEIKQKIDSVLAQDYSGLAKYHKEHQECAEQLDEVSARLTVVPQHDEAGPLYSRIKAITLEIGEMEKESQTLEILEAQEKSKLVLLNSKIRKILSAKKARHRNQLGLELAPKIQIVLEEYSHLLRAKKIMLLESNILDGIKKCFHKSRLITDVSIDPKTYKVILYSNENEIPKETLSQGELQLYVMAIVWGLAKTSGRPLPFIVDTPLARLDMEHRENLIQNFYPDASHQIIMFSTNTEVVNSYYDLIKPHVSQTMLIQYDSQKDESTIGEGYFRNMGGSQVEI